MTTVKELIDKLQEIEDKDLHVFVWEGYGGAASITTKFIIKNEKGYPEDKFILLESE